MYMSELADLYRKSRRHGGTGSPYNTNLVVPCVFNSGCAVGKRGMTAIEITDAGIPPVHWFDQTRSTKHFRVVGSKPERLRGSDYYRTVLRRDCLDYIFNRITLLSERRTQTLRRR
jgi:hypothetical protein